MSENSDSVIDRLTVRLFLVSVLLKISRCLILKVNWSRESVRVLDLHQPIKFLLFWVWITLVNQPSIKSLNRQEWPLLLTKSFWSVNPVWPIFNMDFVTEEPCLCFELAKENGSFGIQIVGGLDQDSTENPFCPGDTGIFIHRIEDGSSAQKSGKN